MNTASPYQNGDDAFELLLHQVTDDLVVEILHRLPLHHGKNNWEKSTSMCSQHTMSNQSIRNPDTPTDTWTRTSASPVRSEQRSRDNSALDTSFPHRCQREKPTDSAPDHNGLFERCGHVSPTFRSATGEFIRD